MRPDEERTGDVIVVRLMGLSMIYGEGSETLNLCSSVGASLVG